jgi:hypothetical protein
LPLAKVKISPRAVGAFIGWGEDLNGCDQTLLGRGFVDLHERLAVFLLDKGAQDERPAVPGFEGGRPPFSLDGFLGRSVAATVTSGRNR